MLMFSNALSCGVRSTLRGRACVCTIQLAQPAPRGNGCCGGAGGTPRVAPSLLSCLRNVHSRAHMYGQREGPSQRAGGIPQPQIYGNTHRRCGRRMAGGSVVVKAAGGGNPSRSCFFAPHPALPLRTVSSAPHRGVARPCVLPALFSLPPRLEASYGRFSSARGRIPSARLRARRPGVLPMPPVRRRVVRGVHSARGGAVCVARAVDSGWCPRRGGLPLPRT